MTGKRPGERPVTRVRAFSTMPCGGTIACGGTCKSGGL